MNCTLHKLPLRRDRRYTTKIVRSCERGCIESEPLDYREVVTKPQETECLCGCGEAVTQPKSGRPRKFVNATHRKRGQRQHRRSGDTPEGASAG